MSPAPLPCRVGPQEFVQDEAALFPAGTYFRLRRAGASPAPGGYRYYAKLAPSAPLKWIVTRADAEAFAAEFGVRREGGPLAIRWADVARRFAGVVYLAKVRPSPTDAPALFWLAKLGGRTAVVWDGAALEALVGPA